jgi:hypothetical protein
MYDYKREHFKFVRCSGLKRSDFEGELDHSGSWLALGVALTILVILIVGATL